MLYLRNVAQAKSKKDKGYTKRGILIQDSREKARRKGRRKPLGEARPLNLLNIALCGLASFERT